MLAGQGAQGKQPLLGRFKRGRVEIHGRQRILDPARGLAQFDQRPAQCRHGLVQAVGPFLRRGAFEPADSLDDHALGPRIARSAGQHLVGAGHIAADALGRLHPAAGNVQRLVLARLGRQRLQLAHGMAKEILLLARGLQRSLGLGQGCHRLAPGRPGGADGGNVDAAKGIEQLPMPAGIEQPPVIMLAVQLDQNIRQPAQDLARHPPVIDPAGLAPVGCVDAAQDQLVLDLDPGLGQQIAGGMSGGQIEHGRHLALGGACAHQLGPPAPAQDKAQAIEQDRLARPRLAGQHVQARREFQRQPVDQQDVADVQHAQHHAAPCPVRATCPG